MHISVRMTTISFWMGFRHAHFCTNDYPFLLNGFSSCTCCTNDLFIIFNGMSSFTFLYGWLYSHFEGIFVMYISVRMTTFSFWMDFRHIHFCTNDYLLILNGFSSYTFLYEWLPFLFEWVFVMYISVRMTTISFWMDCFHVHFCTNDYHFFLKGLSSCTFLCEWQPFLFEWICNVRIAKNLYFSIFPSLF